MLTRESLQSGRYFDTLELPPEYRWPQSRIDASLAETLAARPDNGDDLWIFAYGSLMWNPLLEFDRRELATLHGWRRRFSIRSVAGRGSIAIPGRMLALEPGGTTQGVALQLPRLSREQELRVVWTREMISGAYLPTWAPVTLADDTDAYAIVFVANAAQPLFERDASVGTSAPIIARASGSFGTNAEYVFQLEASLLEHQLHDAYIASLAAELRRLIASEGRDG
ncbi:gamma-glutamylcyclotransferase [Cupriavidus pampae]|uniref:glutathione-specific gamma-glutamylcyclotransferase n=1 Tax=Cupriavidus pampae TaxID=659251 RepID=A0ABM8WAR4_9BURK|nr:gamma-glutamylcyclotransferase [Cupriavidus pampae]CAG9164334.1 Glutathione-specific gamma-glutamylcyclotransferase [Cupriavidus pampae]